MNNFTTIYKILKAIERSMDYEEFDSNLISPESLGITKERRDKLLIEMQEDGYIRNVNCSTYFHQGTVIHEPIKPTITIKGLEYLANNSMMKKASDLIKGAVDIIK